MLELFALVNFIFLLSIPFAVIYLLVLIRKMSLSLERIANTLDKEPAGYKKHLKD